MEVAETKFFYAFGWTLKTAIRLLPRGDISGQDKRAIRPLLSPYRRWHRRPSRYACRYIRVDVVEMRTICAAREVTDGVTEALHRE